MPDYEEVRIFHPGTKGDYTAPRSSLATWYRSGWRLVDESEPPAPAEAEPEPISAAEVAAALKPDAADAKAASKTTSAKSTKE
jgi:hypothetical protein